MESNHSKEEVNESNDLHEDLKAFNATRKSLNDLIQVKRKKKADDKDQEEHNQDVQEIEDKAKTALDKLFKGKSA